MTTTVLHEPTDTYERRDARLVVRCAGCGWMTDPITPTFDPNGSVSDDTLDALHGRWIAHAVAFMPDPPMLLDLRRDEGGSVRWQLAGVPIHCGERLEIKLDGDVWTPIRFEVKSPGLLTKDPYGRANPIPIGYFSLAGPLDGHRVGHPQAWFVIPPDAVLRWPQAGR